MDDFSRYGDREILLDKIYAQMTDTFYERQHGHYLVRKPEACGADIDVLMNMIEEFLGIQQT